MTELVAKVVLKYRSLPDMLAYLSRRFIPVTLEAVLKQAAVTQFDGAVTLHFRKGTPVKVEAGRPAQADLLTQDESPSTMGPHAIDR